MNSPKPTRAIDRIHCSSFGFGLKSRVNPRNPANVRPVMPAQMEAACRYTILIPVPSVSSEGASQIQRDATSPRRIKPAFNHRA